MLKNSFMILFFLLPLCVEGKNSEDPTIKDIYLCEKKIIGTTAVIDFSSFDVDSSGLVSTTGGINLSGGTAGGANTIDLGSNGNDDLTATDWGTLTDGVSNADTLHTHALTGIKGANTLDDAYNNDAGGDRTITVDARDVSFDLNDATNDYKVSIDNTTTVEIASALEFVATSTITTAIDASDVDIVNALNLGANNIRCTGCTITNTSGDITFATNGTGDVVISSTDWDISAAGTISDATLIRAANGSVTAPSYSFNTDTDTGMFLNAAGDLRIVAGGSGNAITLRIQDTAVSTTDGIYIHISAKTSSNAVCHRTSTDSTTEDVLDCSSQPSDIAEGYETEQDVEAGDLVTTSQNLIQYQGARLDENNGVFPGEMYQGATLEKSVHAYQQNLLGVISTAPHTVMGEDVLNSKNAKHPLPLALAGRVPVKVSMENGPIAIGDPITSSSTAGVGMKATQAGPIVGIALEPFAKSSIGKIVMYVMNKTSYVPQKNLKFVQDLSDHKNADSFVEMLKSKEWTSLIRDKKSLEILKTMIGVYKGTSRKDEIAKLINVPAETLNKLSTISRYFISHPREHNKGSLPFILDQDLVVKGNFMQTVQTKSNKERITYVQTAIEPTVIARGEATLKNGSITVDLDPVFLQTVEITHDHPLLVQLTPRSLELEGPLVVVERTKNSFTVQEAGDGASNAVFVWEVSARRKVNR